MHRVNVTQVSVTRALKTGGSEPEQRRTTYPNTLLLSVSQDTNAIQ
jgi:hypothetical protein